MSCSGVHEVREKPPQKLKGEEEHVGGKDTMSSDGAGGQDTGARWVVNKKTHGGREIDTIHIRGRRKVYHIII